MKILLDRYFIEVGLATIHTSNELMQRLASALNFPERFGGNWDALLDVVTDLSWNPAFGYVLLLKEAKSLLQLPSEHFVIFIRLCLAAVERWQSGEDEEGKLVSKTPFYFIFQGEESFCRLLGDLVTNAKPS